MLSNQSDQRPKRNWWIFGPFLAVMLGLNFWLDYYHPLGFLFDFAVAIWLLFKWDSIKRRI